MSVWDVYSDRMNASGVTQRQASLKRERHLLEAKMGGSLSYQSVTIDGVSKNVSIINSDNINEKTILSLPGEYIDCGGIVYWENNYWLITERDAGDELYTKAKMVQCNHKLKWVDETHTVREQWCVIEDGTKLKQTMYVVCNSLAYWKRYVKTIPLIAGTPLEPHKLQHTDETNRSVNV